MFVVKYKEGKTFSLPTKELKLGNLGSLSSELASKIAFHTGKRLTSQEYAILGKILRRFGHEAARHGVEEYCKTKAVPGRRLPYIFAVASNHYYQHRNLDDLIEGL